MSASFSIEEIRKLAQESAAESQAKQIAAIFDDPTIPSDALLWISLVPDRTWTLPLAHACFFPSQPSSSIEDTFNQLNKRNIARFKDPFLSVNGNTRPLILQRYLDDPKHFSILRSTLARVGQALTKAAADAPSFSPLTARWAALAASAEQGAALARVFDTAVSAAAAEQNTADILSWIDAARPLAALLARDLDQSLELAIKRAGQRVELIHRMKADEEHLHSFYRRHEQIDAVTDLLADNDHWALHLIGVGGVGKTMLIRHISAQMTRERDLVTARIDFDYLNADYPTLAPGLLLWSFSQQLSAYDQSQRAESSFHEADNCLNKLHEFLASQPASPIRGTDHSLFRLALGFYIDALKILATDENGSPRNIVLILDTCEELAKVSPDGTAPINVIETFRILEALRYGVSALDIPPGLPIPNNPNEGVPELRVIFSGRRLLASEGLNWRAESSLASRSYLRLHEIRGFTEREARSFLLERAQVGEKYVDAIIKRSKPELGRVPDLVRADAFDELEVQRCNPFELKLYADWAHEEPPPTPEMISTASNSQYVEERILRRLGFDAPEPVFQAVALLGHFDQNMLSAIAGETSQGTWEHLAEQEWTDQRVESIKQGTEIRRVLSVSPGVRKRLLEYFRDRWGLGAIWQRTATYLEDITLTQPLSELSWYTFDAALRVLELSPDPTRAARWWEAVERRILGERDFEWARQVTAFLQGSDGAAGSNDSVEEESTLRPAVLATYAATLLHGDSKGLLKPVWDEVYLKASRHPEPKGRVELALRSAAGRVAASRYSGEAPSAGDFAVLVSSIDELPKTVEADLEVAAAFVAAAETLVEQSEQELLSKRNSTRIQIGNFVPLLAEQLANIPSITIRSFACSLAGRSEAVLRDYGESLRWFKKSLEFVRRIDREELTYLNWIPPSNVRARVMLEFARTAYPAFFSAVDVLQEIGPLYGLDPRGDLDVDRLLSLHLRLRAATMPVPPAELMQGEGHMLVETSYEHAASLSNAHFEVPSLALTCRELLALGGVLLDGLENFQGDLNFLQQSEAILARITQRMRLNQNSRVSFPGLEESPRADHRSLVWVLRAFEGAGSREPVPTPPSDAIDPLAWRHAIWRTRFTLNSKKLSEVSDWASKHILESENSEPEDVLDWTEASFLVRTDKSLRKPDFDEPPHRWWMRHQDEPERALRYWLRNIALSDAPKGRREHVPDEGPPGQEITWKEIVDRLGMCRAAEIAREEGDLLSLRLPDRASTILAQSLTWFEECQCWTGVVISGGALGLIQGRRSKKEELKETLDKVHKAYKELKGTNWELPDWTQLEVAASTNVKTEATGTNWSPWIQRLTLGLAFREQLRNSGTPLDVTNLYNSLSSTSVARTSNRADTLFADVCQCFSVSTSASSSTIRLSIAGSSESSMVVWGYYALGLASLAAMVYFTFLGLKGSAMLLMDNHRLLHGLRGSFLDIRRYGIMGRLIYAALTCTIIASTFLRRVRPYVKYLGLICGLLYGAAFVQLAITRWLPAQAKVAGFFGSSDFLGIALFALLYYMAGKAVVGSITSGRLAIHPSGIAFHQERLDLSYARNIDLPGKSSAPEQLDEAEESEHLFDLPFGFFLSLKNIRSITETPEAVPISPYQKLNKLLSEDIQSSIRKVKKMLMPFQRMEIVVEPSEGQHAASWEAMIALAIDSSTTSPRNIPFRFRRDPLLARPPERPELTDVAAISTSGIGEELARRTWKKPFQLRIVRAPELNSAMPQLGVQVLHTIASVEEGYAGIRLRLGETTEPERLSERSTAKRGYANTVSARDIKLAFPNLALCVLQGLVSPLPNERVDADRRQAGLTRTFAAELFRQGVSAILVIPPLDDKRATVVLSAVTAALGSRTSSDVVWLSTRTLEQASINAQHIIFTESSESAEVKWERAMDVCLYCVRTTGLQIPRKKAKADVTVE